MSTDQQWAGGGMRGYQHEQIHERRVPVRKRILPFVGLWLLAFLLFPALELICWVWGHFNETAQRELTIGWLGSAAVFGFMALSIGTVVARRTPFVVWHVVVTVFGACFAAGVTTQIGLFTTTWQVIHFFASLFTSVTWTMYRVDSLRSIAQGTTKDAWGELIGLARSRPRKVTTDEHHVIIDVEHGPGETQRTVEQALPKLESAVGAIAGRSTVQGGERGDRSTITLQLSDPFAAWRTHPGLSHPGGSFAHPFRTAYYATGADEWFSFVRSLPSSLTSYRSPSATFVGAAGTTGSGKSGFLMNAAAEALSRVDAVLCWADAAKFFQNAGWCSDMLGMAAKEKAQARRMTSALRKLADYRVELFGQAELDAILDPDAPQIGREWTPELAQELGEPAVLVIVDEADTIIQTKAWEWLGARGRSLGIFLLVATPRASTNEVSAVFRGSIATWKTFAIGDKYSDDFTLSQETKDAGADPKRLREPGLHYLDLAPGVNQRMYPVLAREFQSSGRMLRSMVLKAREGFTPAQFSPNSIMWMGDDYAACLPSVVLGVKTPQQAIEDAEREEETDRADEAAEAARAAAGADDTPTRELTADERAALEAHANETPSDRVAAEDDEQEEEEMLKTESGTRPDDDEVSVVDQSKLFDRDSLRELAGIDPRQPIPDRPAGQEPIRLPDDDDKPRWSSAETEKELDRALRSLAERGLKTFGNSDLIEEMRCAFSEATASRRLDALSEGQRLAPPGLEVKRLGRGRFALIESKPRPNRREN